MNRLPLQLVMFATTKGHFGRTEIYKDTVNGLFSQISPTIFEEKIVHIKTCAAEEATLNDMKQFFSGRGFEVIVSHGEWKHFTESHQKEYLKDIIKVFSTPKASRAKYTLWLEDDWLFNVKQQALYDWFILAMNILEANPEILTTRFCHHYNEFERINNLIHKHGIDAQAIKVDDLFFLNNDLYSFNPHISRTRDLFITSLLAERHLAELTHSEMGFSQIIKQLSRKKYSLAAFNTDLIQVEHIGVELKKPAIVSYCSEEYKPLAELTVNQNKAVYCQKYGYDNYIKYVESTTDKLAGFDRMEYLAELMRTTTNSWFWVMGVDTMIMNFNTKIEDFIDDKYHFIISKDCNGFNADSYLIRNSVMGKKWLNFILSKRKEYENDTWVEQRVIMHFAETPEWQPFIKTVPQQSFNSYEYGLYNIPREEGNFKEGDFLIHWPGCSLKQRLELVDKYKPLIKN